MRDDRRTKTALSREPDGLHGRLAGDEGPADGTPVEILSLSKAHERTPPVLGTAADCVPVALALLNSEFVLREYNRIYADLIRGYTPHTPEHALGRPYFDCAPGGLASAEAWFREVADSGRAGRINGLELVTKQHGLQQLAYWDVRAIPLTAPSGQADGMVIVMQSATERKVAEEAVRDGEERLRRLFDLSPIGAAIVGLDWRFELVNAELCRIMGYPEGELLSLAWPDITHPDDQATNSEQVARLLSGEIDHLQTERRYIRKDGEVVWGSLSCRLMRNPEGDPQYFMPLIQDITEQRRLEAQLHRSQRLEAIGNLAGGIAHEFKNLLMAISGYSEVLQVKLGPDHPQYATTNDLLDCVDRASRVIGQLLTFSRRQATHTSVIDLREVVRDSRDLSERLLGEHISMEIDLAKKPVTVDADASQIEQVVVNLIINARDAMPSGGKLRISVCRRRSEDARLSGHSPLHGGEFAELKVWDTGMGMDEATRDRIFEPFFTTKDKRQRTGLGLSVAYGIIKQHKGEIHVFSQPGEGTCFIIYLPLHATSVRSPRKKATPAPQRGDETILLVEDEESVRKSSIALLEEYGYTVLTAGDFAEAVGLLKDNSRNIDLAVLDAVVPGGSGKDLWQEVEKFRPGLRVIFISGYGQKDMAQHDCRPARYAPFLSKPFSLKELTTKVRTLLDNASRTQS